MISKFLVTGGMFLSILYIIICIGWGSSLPTLHMQRYNKAKKEPYKKFRFKLCQHSRPRPKQRTSTKKGIPLYPNLNYLKSNTMKNTMQRYGPAHRPQENGWKKSPISHFFNKETAFWKPHLPNHDSSRASLPTRAPKHKIRSACRFFYEHCRKIYKHCGNSNKAHRIFHTSP